MHAEWYVREATMEPLLTHPSGLRLLHEGGHRFDLHTDNGSLTGPFTLHWDLTGSHGQPLELCSETLVLSDLAVSPDGLEATLEYHVHDGALAGVQLRLSPLGLELTHLLTRTAGWGKQPLRANAFRLNTAGLEGSFLEGLGEAPGWRFFPTAYNSFSPAFVRDSRAVVPIPRYAPAATFNQYADSVYWGNWSDLSTAWMAALHRAGEAPTLLLGWLEARVGLGEIAIRRRRPPQLEARLGLGGKQLEPDRPFRGDPLLIAFAGGDASSRPVPSLGIPLHKSGADLPRERSGWDSGSGSGSGSGSDSDPVQGGVVPGAGDALIDQWAREVGRRMGARVPEGDSPAGWCSWYYYYTDVTETDVHRNLEALATHRRRLPIRYVQLDDGYQAKVGDWLTPNRKFRSGLADLARRIRAAGFVPGIWTAPFLVQRTSEVFRRHPDRLIQDDRGRPKMLTWHYPWGLIDGQVYCLDPSHPEVLEHLTKVFTTLVGYGYDYFKIDFLMAGLQEGRRHDRGLSPVEAYRRGLASIRSAIGDRFLLGCGAPLEPTVGYVDAMRISPDVKEIWRDRVGELAANGAGHPAADMAVLNCLTRSHLHRVWWLNDPDCLLVREKRSALKQVEVQTLLTVLSLTGGMLFLSDDLEALEPGRRALAELALPPGGTAARALGLQEEPRPRRYVRFRRVPEWQPESGTSYGKASVDQESRDGRPGGGTPHGQADREASYGQLEALAAVINWGEEVEEWAIAPEDVGLPSGDYHVYEYWSRTWRYLKVGEAFPITLDPHETALLLFRPVRPHPQLITATHHLGQTTVIVARETWDPTGTLRIDLRTGAHREGQLLIAVPEGYTAGAIETGGGASLTGRSTLPGALRLSVPVDEEGSVWVKFIRREET